MARILFFASLLVIIATAILGIKGCIQDAIPEKAKTNPSLSDSIVSLPDNSTLLAPDGTVGRELTNWLANPGAGAKRFELGGQQFVGDSSVLTGESKGRITRLVSMLRAYPDVNLTIIGHSDASGDSARDEKLATARAATVANALESDGIAADRLKLLSYGSRVPFVENDVRVTPQQERRVSLEFVRK